MLKIKSEDLYYPNAINWMWNYCIPLGKFTDSKGNNYDLGIFIPETAPKIVSAAIVCGNNEGDYYSGNLKEHQNNNNPDINWYYEKYIETYKRAKNKNLI